MGRSEGRPALDRELRASARRGAASGWLTLLAGAAICICLAGSACAPQASQAPTTPEAPRAAPIDFAFPPIDGVVVSSETTRGRATLLAFITTYDLVSQMLVRRLGEVVVEFTPRANAVAVVMEAPSYADLLPAYRESLSLPFPVVMVDFATEQGQGPFGDIAKVPTLVVLDREGREVWRHQGPLGSEEIRAALRRASPARD